MPTRPLTSVGVEQPYVLLHHPSSGRVIQTVIARVAMTALITGSGLNPALINPSNQNTADCLHDVILTDWNWDINKPNTPISSGTDGVLV